MLTGYWRLADPKISLASLAAMFLAASVASVSGPLHWPWLAVTVLGILSIEIAKNASGELFDFDSGTDQRVTPEDRSPFSGGKRVLVDGLLTRTQCRAIAWVHYLLGAFAGFAIVLWREPRVIWFGLAGMALAYFYHAGPLRLSYRGWGEIAVATAYGPLTVCGTFLVQRGTVATPLLWASVSLGLLIAAFLWVNEFPDYHADAASGKRTWVVRLGRTTAAKVFTGILLAAFALVPVSQGWGGLTAIPLAGMAAVRLWRHPEAMGQIIPAQALTLGAFVLFALATGLFWRYS